MNKFSFKRERPTFVVAACKTFFNIVKVSLVSVTRTLIYCYLLGIDKLLNNGYTVILLI